MDIKKEFLNHILSVNDDLKEAKFRELRDRIVSGDKQAQELLDFLSNYDEVSVRYYAKKICQELNSLKKSDTVADDFDVGDILKNLGEGERNTLEDEKVFKSINIEALTKYLKDPDFQKRIKAIQGASQMGDPQALPHLVNALAEEKHPFVRATLVKYLGSFRDPKMIPVIADYLKDPDHRTRANAIEGLEQINDTRVVEFLVSMLQDPEHRVRANAAKVLVRFGKQDVLGVLEKMTSSPAVWLQESAIYALGEIQSAEALRILKDKYVSAEKDSIKSAIIRVVSRYDRNADVTAFLRNARAGVADKESELGRLIDHTLGAKSSVKGSERKKTAPWLIATGAVAAIVVVAAGLFFFMQSKETQDITDLSERAVAFSTGSQAGNQVELQVPQTSESFDDKSLAPVALPVDSSVDLKHTASAVKESLPKIPPDKEKPVESPIIIPKEVPKEVQVEKLVDPLTSPAPEPVKNALPETPAYGTLDDMLDGVVARTDKGDPVAVSGSTDYGTTVSPDQASPIADLLITPPIFPSDQKTGYSESKNAPEVSSSAEVLSTIIDWARSRSTRETAMEAGNKSVDKKKVTLVEKLAMFGIDDRTKAKILSSMEKEKEQLGCKVLFVYPKASNLGHSGYVYSKGFTDFMISNFSKLPGVDVIDRDSVHGRMVELGISNREMDRRDNAQRLGELFGVQYVVYGEVKEIGNNYDNYFREFIDIRSENQGAIDVFIEGNLNQNINDNVAVAQLSEDEKEDIVQKNYQSGKYYYERKKYYEAYQHLSLAQRVLDASDNSREFEDLGSYVKLAENGYKRVSDQDREKLKKNVIISHSLKMLSVSERKVVWEKNFNKELFYFRDILKLAFADIYQALDIRYSKFTTSSLLTGFTDTLESFLLLYKAIDTMDYDLGEVQSTNIEETVLKLIAESLDKDNDYSDAYYYRSLIYARRNNIERALSEAEKASLLDPTNIRIRYQTAFYRRKLGDKKGADMDLEKISQLKSVHYTDVLSRAHLDLAYRHFKEGNRTRAFAELQNAMIVEPVNGETFLAIGLYYLDRSDMMKAFYGIEEADRLFGDSFYTKVVLADILKSMEDYDSMIAVLKEAILLVNRDQRFLTGGKYRLDKFDRAPEYPVNAVYYLLGAAFKAKGNQELSQSYFRQCVAMDPHNDYSYKARREIR
ncbi:MAG: HEAT repeat domain-containing protein [Candidatus Wallbacteria bacterium]|nr:HEAT repeat domain-containing protein [Candidatus Wallbacteria bacterium]